METAEPIKSGVGIGIVAFGATKSLVDWTSSEWTYWTMNDAYNYFARRFSATFEMHQISHYTDPKHYKPDHEARLAGFSIRAYGSAVPGSGVYLAYPNPNIPNATTYPLDEVVAHFGGRRYFLSSICYMIPLAVMTIEASLKAGDGLFAPRLGLWGCDMGLTTEYAKERACVEYWLRAAEDRGIEVVIPDESPLLKSAYLYGYDMPKIAEHQRIILARRKELQEQYAAALDADRAANDRVSALQGMLAEVTFFESNLTEAAPMGEPFK